MVKSLSKAEYQLVLDRLVDVLDAIPLNHSCVACGHFEEGPDVCKLAGIRPPARVIVNGCAKFERFVPF